MERRVMPTNHFSTRPLYLQLRDALAERVAAGEWKPGERSAVTKPACALDTDRRSGVGARLADVVARRGRGRKEKLPCSRRAVRPGAPRRAME